MQRPSHPCLARAIFIMALPILAGPSGAIPTTGKADEPVQTVAAAPSATSRLVAAANAFLATLDDKQRARVLFAFNDDKQRARWSNFPTGFVPRGGVSLKELNDTQSAAAMALVSAALSPRGFEKVQQIMEADEVFKATNHGTPGGNDHPGGQGRPPFDRDKQGNQDHPPSGPGDDHGHPPFGGPNDGGHGRPPACLPGGPWQ